MYIFLQQKAGINGEQQQGRYISLNNIHKSLDSEKQKFVNNMATIRKQLFSGIDVTKKNWFDSENFKKNAFDIIKQFSDFEENLRSDFFKQRGVKLQKPKVDFWDLIKADNFFPTLKDYFSKNVEERKNHKLQTVFNLTDIDLIGCPKSYGNRSTAYRYIAGNTADKDIPENNRLAIFCSLVEFYGKDFFDKLPKQEKEIVKKFYSKNEFDFKLSDLSILGNTNEILKTNDDNSNLDSKFEKNGGYIKNDNKNSFENKILKEAVKSNQREEKSKSNYHIGKTIFFGPISVGVGLYFGWFYSLIPLAALIVIAFLDQRFDRLPGPGKIFCCFRFCQSSNSKRPTKTINPNLITDDQNKDKDDTI